MSCNEESQRYQSPTSRLTNRLLWGDPDKGEFGLLIRTADEFESEDFLSQQETDELHYVPASVLHASLRPLNGVFILNQGNMGVAFVTGTKYKKNWSMKNFQSDGSIDTPAFYPVDGNSINRKSLWNINGTGCYNKERRYKSLYHCIEGKCLTYKEPERSCGCNTEDVPSHKFGEHYTKYLKGRTFKEDRLSRVSCWYPGTSDGWSDMIKASNSLWKERKKRSTMKDHWYHGWTEVPATKHIRDEENIDAILIKLPPTTKQDVSLCDMSPHKQDTIQRRLEHMGNPSRGRTMPHIRSLPVVFYAETEGMSDPEECNRVWNGEDCGNGYRKEFFSQRFNFSNGACLYSPDGCKDVYYFPRDNDTGGCSAFSEGQKMTNCRKRELHLNHVGCGNHTLEEEEVYDIADPTVGMAGNTRVLEDSGSTSVYPGTHKQVTQEKHSSFLFILLAAMLLWHLVCQRLMKAKNCSIRKYV